MYHAARKAADNIIAQRCYDCIVLRNFFSSVGEHHSNKRHAHSQWNNVSTEDTEVDVFRVIYGSLWIISICTWSTFSAHFLHVFLCIRNPFPFYSTELLGETQFSHKLVWLAEWFTLFQDQSMTNIGCRIWEKVHISSLQDVFVDHGQHCQSKGSDSPSDWWWQ